MLRIDLCKATEGMELALPVQNPRVPSRTILRVGYRLTEPIIEKLFDAGVRSLWVRYPNLDFLRKLVDLEPIGAHAGVLTAIADCFENLQNHTVARFDYHVYTAAIRQMVETIMTDRQSAIFLGELCDCDDELMRHSSAVAYLSLLISLKLETYLVKERPHVPPERAKNVNHLGQGAMLHDIGITGLPPHVRQRYRETGNETDPDWQEHPALGFHMTRGKLEPSAAAVVLNHHQRFDGSGYAGEGYSTLHGRALHVFTRIVGLAEQFDRLRNPPHLPAQPTVFVLQSLLSREMLRRFDPRVMAALLEVVPAYPPGSVVRLSDGRSAVCIDPNSQAPCRPRVQIIPEPVNPNGDNPVVGPLIDLNQQTSRLYVAEIDGQDVSDVNFDRPKLPIEERRLVSESPNLN